CGAPHQAAQADAEDDEEIHRQGRHGQAHARHGWHVPRRHAEVLMIRLADHRPGASPKRPTALARRASSARLWLFPQKPFAIAGIFLRIRGLSGLAPALHLFFAAPTTGTKFTW